MELADVWTIVSVAIPLIIGLGVTFAVIEKASSREFLFAKGCFWLSALMLSASTLYTLAITDMTFLSRFLIGCAVGALVFVAFPEGLRWIEGKQVASHEKTMKLGVNEKPCGVAESLALAQPITFNPFGRIGAYYLELNINMRNTGNSRATNAYACLSFKSAEDAKMTFDEGQRLRKADALADKTKEVSVGYVLGPNQTVASRFGLGGPVTGVNDITAEEIRLAAFRIWGYLEYTDLDGVIHHTTFSFTPDGDSSRPWDLKTFVLLSTDVDTN